MADFDYEKFIEDINKDKPKPRNSKDRLNALRMNAPDTQGTLTFIPIFSKGADKGFYMKIQGVYEYLGDTNIIDAEDGAWFRVLPLEFYEDLSDDEIELYNEVKGYLETLNNSGECSYQELRIKSYSLLFGIGKKLKTAEDKLKDNFEGNPYLFIYPTLNVVGQLCDAINAKSDTMGKRDWVTRVFTLNSSGRRGVIQVKFVKATGPGYDCSVTFEMNNSDEGIMVIDPDYEVPAEVMKKFDDVIPTFLGWIYDRENNRRFNVTAMKELRDQLKLRVKDLGKKEDEAPAEEKYENKNNLKPVEGKSEEPAVQPASSSRRPF